MGAVTLDVLTTAGILFIVSAGLMVILGVMKLINFAHGAFLTAGGYVAYVAGKAGLDPWLAIPIAGVVGIMVGLVIERLVIRRLYHRPLDAILATWGLGVVISQLFSLTFGRGVQFAPSPLKGTTSLIGIDYSAYRLALTVIAVLLALSLSALLRYTRFGLNARAVIANEGLARGLGIDSGKVRSVTFGLGAGLACAAGALITPLLSVDPNMGLPWLVNSFMLVMISGVSFPSLLFASLILGGAQVLVSTYVSPVIGGMIIVILAALILRFRPRGLSRA
ncbi:branched-chain amino acid ABC transporter permease [Pseudomonas veronii]|uniref:branched-chain amino acid ABC transporter permease n=1 Tax=Pseudomonas veronii TaxID=76761 RepID=UPI0015A00210|nr:branched-chain amino acid ABC transporter permease [Pseudomonas veronii]NWD56975.1 branched-chain amino acid ABC transporter permease [Pseudomonas veronii]